MQPSEVIETLRRYIAAEILNGKDIGLDGSTPLLEWGILNSLELIRLLSFVNKTYNIEVPMHMVVADHFKDLSSIASMLGGLSGEAAP